MTAAAQRIRDEAMRKAPQPDIRIRTSANESRELTPEEMEKFGLGVQASPAPEPPED